MAFNVDQVPGVEGKHLLVEEVTGHGAGQLEQ